MACLKNSYIPSWNKYNYQPGVEFFDPIEQSITLVHLAPISWDNCLCFTIKILLPNNIVLVMPNDLLHKIFH
jgi:hypothetical protein